MKLRPIAEIGVVMTVSNIRATEKQENMVSAVIATMVSIRIEILIAVEKKHAIMEHVNVHQTQLHAEVMENVVLPLKLARVTNAVQKFRTAAHIIPTVDVHLVPLDIPHPMESVVRLFQTAAHIIPTVNVHLVPLDIPYPMVNVLL